MRIWKTLSFCLMFLATLPCISQTPQAAPTPKPAAHDAKDQAGQHAFENNCARCHNAPQGFSPHISGTILMHMRTRANLSKKDEQDILRFLNP
jgi:mono/diheme cytochrome c family protein